MEKDRQKWNEKYKEDSEPRTPSDIVVKYHSPAPPGIALDLAAGTGRHALYLAERGFEVDAVDISDVAIEQLKGRHPRVNAILADLDTYDISPERYSLILNIRFLDRHLFPLIREGLVPGGVAIFETYLEEKSGNGMAKEYLLRENELLHCFLSLKVLYYEEKDTDFNGGPGREAALVGVRVR